MVIECNKSLNIGLSTDTRLVCVPIVAMRLGFCFLLLPMCFNSDDTVETMVHEVQCHVCPGNTHVMRWNHLAESS